MASRRQSRDRASVYRRGDVREQQILAAAEELLDADGFHALSMSHIADAVGITRPTLYFYFASKEDLLETLVSQTMARMSITLTGWFSDPTQEASEEILYATIASAAEGWRAHGAALRSGAEELSSLPGVRALHRRSLDESVASIAELIERERVGGRALAAPPSATQIARTLMLMTERCLHDAYVAEASETDWEELVQTLTTLWWRSVGMRP